MPSKFRKNIWIKRGDFVICEKIPEGEKVQAEIVHPLDAVNIQHLRDVGQWPAAFARDFVITPEPTDTTEQLCRSVNDIYLPDVTTDGDGDGVKGDTEPAECHNPNWGTLFSSSASVTDVTLSDQAKTIPLGENSRCGFTRERLVAWLDKSGIKVSHHDHPEVFTVEAALEHIQHFPAGHFAKNLFLKDKKRGTFYLLCARHDCRTNLNAIGKVLGLGSGRLRFGSESELFELLGVKQGCVTLFALLNEVRGQVGLLLDHDLISDPDSIIYFHPLDNTASSGITAKDVFTFLHLLHRTKCTTILKISENGEDVQIVKDAFC